MARYVQESWIEILNKRKKFNVNARDPRNGNSMLHVIMRSRLNVQNLLTALSSDHPGVNLIGISVPY